jgi:hypothetical protein
MSDVSPSFEQTDILGESLLIRGLATSTWIDLPTSNSKAISEVLLDCPIDGNSSNSYVRLSFNNGSDFIELRRAQSFSWPVKGGVSYVSISGNNTQYQLVINLEPT